MADKSPQAFRTIREVSDWLEVEAHALRFWESKFSQIKPVKRAGGRRYYRPSDMRLIGGIKMLLHDQGLTIRGVQKLIREEGVAHVASLSPPLDEDMDSISGGQVVEATAVEETAPQTGGFVDIDALAGDQSPTEDVATPVSEEPEDSVEPPAEENADEEAAAPVPETVPDTSEPEPADAAIAAMADAEAEAQDEMDDMATPTPLSELRALIHGAVPFTPSQRQQLAPMVARLEALAARLEGRGPTA
ncbi:MerR family transcriptional regulator [Nioella aestuarii]|uniref:MerR family transcriptional regulator n=1 Tax=Nioella aestuarii TaxID=1662864 RepID=UPI003D7F8272